MTQEFIINDDPERGIKTVGWFLDDGRIHVQTRQYIPDGFFDEIKRQRESWATMRARKRPGTQDHWCPLPVLPHALQDNLMRDGNGKPLHMNDPERDKRLKAIQNDTDYRDLRIFEGKV